ncbi:MAG: NAD(+) synthase [Fibrobacter sp.]|nr:NAD(+) synthase [Fibrobacter sp.]
MNIYMVQMNVEPGNPEENFNTMSAAISRAKKAGADYVLFPAGALLGSYMLGAKGFESGLQGRWAACFRKFMKLNKDKKIIVGDSLEKQFVVVSLEHTYNLGKAAVVKEKYSKVAREAKRPVFYVAPVGTCNSGKNIYAMDGGSCIFDKTGKIVFRMPQFKAAEALVKVDAKGGIKVYDPEGKPAKSFKPYTQKIAEVHDALVLMIRENLKKFHIGRMVIGASGGIDSAVSAALYAEAIGPENVYLVNMPTRFNSSTTKNAAHDLAVNLGCPYTVAPIEGMLNAIRKDLAKCKFERSNAKIKVEGLHYENLQARTRSSSVLLSIASVLGAGITCNGNKSEATAGYCTLYGDSCGVMCALGDLWKVQVYELANYINRNGEIIPKASIDVPASAELSDAMNVDEGKGDPIKYPYHDRLFAYWVDERHALEDTEKLLANGTLCKKIGADEKYFKKLFKTKDAALEDMRAWHRRFRGIALAKRIQFPPILSVSGSAFGGEYIESQG